MDRSSTPGKNDLAEPDDGSVAASDEKNNLSQRALGVIENITSVFSMISTAAVSCIMVLALVIAYHAILDRKIIIKPISVPKTLAENGLSGDVAAVRLRDAVKVLTIKASSSLRSKDLIGPNDLVEFAIPNAGISTKVLATEIARLLGVNRRQVISGELTTADGRLSLRLRLDGKEIFSAEGEKGKDSPEDLFEKAAYEVLINTAPYVLASFEYQSHPERSKRIIDDIILWHSTPDEQVKYAYSLRGVMLRQENRLEDAVCQYRYALKIDADFAVARANMGQAFSDAGECKEAIDEYDAAIKSDPKLIIAYLRRASCLSQIGKKTEADKEFRRIINENQVYAPAHIEFGRYLRAQNRLEDATHEFETAIKLDPTSPFPHAELGIIWTKKSDADKAHREFQKAVDIDPDNAIMNYNLAVNLRDTGQIYEAILQLNEAIKHNDKYALAYKTLAEVLIMFNSNKDDVVMAYEKAIANNPKEVRWIRDYAIFLGENGEPEKAAALSQKADSMGRLAQDEQYNKPRFSNYCPSPP